MTARTNIIVAVAENGVIGRDGDLPWRISADLQRFKKITMGYPIVMGRKTFESLPNGPLPGRQNVIITRQNDYSNDYLNANCLVFSCLDDARKALESEVELMIIGGAAIYAEALKMAKRIFLTEVHAEVEGDVYFPSFDKQLWTETYRQHCNDSDIKLDCSFVVLERA